jgi:periplasmic divalent cation tolerance protein
MRRGTRYCVVLVTAPDLKIARRIARGLLDARLAACTTLLPAVESHYWWQGRKEQGREVLLLIKTERRLLPALESTLLAIHPYDTPEIVALPVHSGLARYLDWISRSVAPSVRAPRKTSIARR